MRTLALVAILTVLTMPAHAQIGGGNGHKGKNDAEKAESERQEKRDEKAYRDSLRHIPKSDQKFDPWAKMR